MLRKQRWPTQGCMTQTFEGVVFRRNIRLLRQDARGTHFVIVMAYLARARRTIANYLRSDEKHLNHSERWATSQSTLQQAYGLQTKSDSRGRVEKTRKWNRPERMVRRQEGRAKTLRAIHLSTPRWRRKPTPSLAWRIRHALRERRQRQRK